MKNSIIGYITILVYFMVPYLSVISALGPNCGEIKPNNSRRETFERLNLKMDHMKLIMSQLVLVKNLSHDKLISLINDGICSQRTQKVDRTFLGDHQNEKGSSSRSKDIVAQINPKTDEIM
ncbi:hypothetical protein CROQUDRAFT_95746 [Cronartium quercuum f. sp. fusiforme G11]|uniref:Uncharacterized protein n=1 Tax=Cronartium quercuum f. sp. fusiforme G11 TaxID=708437 RepID=A0A9P6T970_9BASI|nr:hypothetical protein CROQUDRAFT_95746 [Cronartium quercuum f. sp. fusiforme G11]